MYAEERRQLLVQLARTEGRLQVSAAAERFQVTPETIRRDLEVLDRHGVLRRVHGGAMPTEFLPLGDLALGEREGAAQEQKERIATAALALVPRHGASVLIDAGTTTGRLATLLPPRENLTVFTHSLPVAASISARGGAEVQLLGGRVRGVTQACVGGATIGAYSRIRADICFLGTNGLSLEHGLSTPDTEEGLVKARMVASSRRIVVLCDSTKFGTETAYRFASLDDVDVLVTDAITASQRAHCHERGIEVVVA